MTKSSKTFHQTLSLMTVAFNQLTVGIANGWLAPTLGSLQSHQGEFFITLEESSWIGSLDSLGKIFGAAFAALVLDILGRKVLLTSSSLIFFVMWLVILFARSVPVLCLMRLTFGFFSGINDGTNSTYLAENSSPRIRGVFGTICITLYYVGVLVEFVAATYLSYTHTALLNAFVTFLAFLSVLWIKEPAQFLLMKGKHKQAEKNFAWLHGNSDVIEMKCEFEKIKQNVQTENHKKTSFKDTITSPANYKSFFIIIIIYCLVGSIGYYPVRTFASVAFVASDMLTPNEFTILFGMFQLLVVLFSSFTIGRFNRRIIILISFSLIAFSHVTTAILYYVQGNIASIPYFPWLVFVSITFFASVHAFAYPVIFLIRGELFPLSIKATGGCISIISYSTMSFLTTKLFLHIRTNYGIEANFVIFTFVSLFLVVFVYFLLPETRNKSLVEIQEMLEKTNSS